MEEARTCMEKAGTCMEKAGTRMEKAGTHMEKAHTSSKRPNICLVHVISHITRVGQRTVSRRCFCWKLFILEIRGSASMLAQKESKSLLCVIIPLARGRKTVNVQKMVCSSISRWRQKF